MSEGIELDQDLSGIDEGIKKIVNSSKMARETFIKEFEAMDKQGVQKLISGLSQIEEKLRSIGSLNFQIKGNSSNISKPMEQVSKSATKAIDDVNKVSSTISELGKTKDGTNNIEKRLNSLMNSFKKLQNEITIFKQWESGNLLNTKDYAHIGRVADELDKVMVQYHALYEAQKRLSSDSSFKNKLEDIKGESLEMQKQEKIMQDMREYYKDLEKGAKKTAKEEQERTKILEKERKEREKIARQEYENRARLYREENFKKNRTYEGAMSFSKSANTINREILAIKNLEAARNSLSRTDEKYKFKLGSLNNEIKRHRKEIERAKGASELFKNSQRNLLDISSQLQRRLALIFSVSQVSAYINKLIDVRGEFELQQRAMQAIIQNKEEADEIWNKTVQLAVKSPFRVKELVTYTKQLAAYRVETEKLYDTNRMLADVSAGLGVDMNRLILAFGQVKAANYLRGTELRQFSEAGINILAELSKYFSEIEGQAVSVGDVFQRVSQRLVSFADVEEIFKRITSEGGTFYKMQEIQSETLKGQIANLYDSLDLMLNKIGQENDSVLKDAVILTRNIVDNWEEISDVALPFLTSFLLRWTLIKTSISGSNLFGNIINQLTAVTIQLSKGTKAAKAFASLSGTSIFAGWVTVITALIASGIALYNVFNRNKKEAEELSKIDISGRFDAQTKFAEYKKLTSIINDTSKSYDEQQKTLATLKRKYEDILPSQMLEYDYIKKIGNNYNKAKEAIYEYIGAKTKEKQIDYIQKKYEDSVIGESDKLARRIQQQVSYIFDKTDIPLTFFSEIVNKLKSEIESNEISRDLQSIRTRLNELIYESFNIDASKVDLTKTYGSDRTGGTFKIDYLQTFYSSVLQYKEEIDKITNRPSTFSKYIYKEFNEIKEKYDKIKDTLSDNLKVIQDYYNNVGNATEDEANKAQAAIEKMFNEIGIQSIKWGDIIKEPFKMQEQMFKTYTSLYSKMYDEINRTNTSGQTKAAKENFIENLREELENFKGNKLQQEVARVLSSLSVSMNTTSEGLQELMMESEESMQDYAERVKSFYNRIVSDTKRYESDVKNKTHFSLLSPDIYERELKQIPMIRKFLKLIEVYLDSGKKGAEEEEKIFSKRIQLVEDLKKSYDDLIKTFSKSYSKDKVLSSYKKTFNDLFKGTNIDISKIDFTNETSFVRSLEKLTDLAKKSGNKAVNELQKILSEHKLKVDIELKKEKDEELKRQIEDMFSGYELSVELSKLNIPKDFAKDLFNVDLLDLDELGKKLNEIKPQFTGSDMENEWKNRWHDYQNIRDKSYKEDMLKYIEYARKAVTERAKIKIDELNKIQSIEKAFSIKKEDSEETKKAKEIGKNAAIKKAKKDAEEAIQKLDWEDFKKSETFVSLFNDIDMASEALINHSIKKLDEFKKQWKNMPLEDTKFIIDKINILNEKLAEIHPFKQKKRDQELLETRKKDKEFESEEAKKYINKDYLLALQLENVFQEEKIKKDKDELKLLETILNKKNEGKMISANDIELNSEQLSYLNMNKSELDEIIKKKKESINLSKKSTLDNSQDIATLLRIKHEYLEQSKAIKKIQSLAEELYNSFSSLNDIFGDSESPSAEFAKMGMNMADIVMKTLVLQLELKAASVAAKGFAAAMNAALGPIGWITMGIQLLVEAFTAIVQVHDKKIEKKIKKEREHLEYMKEAYEDLNKIIERGPTMQSYTENARLIENLKKQEESILRMISLEEDKKKTDHEKIKEWKNEINDIQNQINDLYESIKKNLVGDFKSISEELGSGLVDAAKNGEDAFEHMGDSINDIITNILKNLLVMKFIEPEMEKLVDNLYKSAMPMTTHAQLVKENLDNVNKQIKKEEDLYKQGYGNKKYYEDQMKMLEMRKKQLEEEYELAVRQSEGEIPDLKEDAINRFKDSLSSFIKEWSESPLLEYIKDMQDVHDTMTGLQKGIQGITEAQADALAALAESIRFLVADNNLQLKKIVDSLGNNSEDSPNPVLAQLKIIANRTTEIKNLLESVVKNYTGGKAMRVQIV